MEFYYSKSIERPDPTHAGPQQVGIVRDYDHVEVFPDEDKTRPFEIWAREKGRGKLVLLAQCETAAGMLQTLEEERKRFPPEPNHPTMPWLGHRSNICWIDIRTPVKWLGSTTRRDDAWIFLLEDRTYAVPA